MKCIKVLFLFATAIVLAKNPTPKKINWIDFEKAIKLNRTNPKPILVDVYTDWCGWCRKMDATTYENDVVVAYINQNFYAVKFNAEQKEPIVFNGRTFKFIARGRRGYHELAAAILSGKMSYPATVFFNKQEQLLKAIPGYLEAPKMEKLIHYMGKEIYLTKDWDVFEKEFKGSF